MPSGIRRHGWSRTLSVIIIYVLAVGVVAASVTFIIRPITTQVDFLVQEFPGFALKVYSAAPEAVRGWWDEYSAIVPDDIRLALQRTVESTFQSLMEAVQVGIFRTLGVAFSTVSFVLGLVVVPLWMFYILRDQPQMIEWLYRLIPGEHQEDARNIQGLIDAVLGAYLRGQLILCLSVAIMFMVGLGIMGIELALLLGTIAGVFEIVPVLGPILGAIPAVLVTLATDPRKALGVIVLAFAVQQIENYVLVPQVTGETVKLHPAIVMLILVVGSEVAGIWGVVLGVPLTAVVRDVLRYLYLRLSDEPLSASEAMARLHGDA
jgi:predicted PurR-regulated permease PerM